MLIEQYKEMLKNRLTKKRYIHSLNVADEAVRLAKKYGEDIEKAYLVGLLHDIMKDTSSEIQLQYMLRFGIILSNVEKKAPKLWHAIAGATYLKNELGVNDEDMLNAIKYHTTGRAEMSLLERILYIADFTSAERDYDDVDIIRTLADESLEEAMLYGIAYTIRDLTKKKSPIHPDSFALYNELVCRDK